MAIETGLTAGAYSTTYSGSAIGISEAGGNLILEPALEDIAPSDSYGLTVIDSVYRGGQCYLDFMLMTWRAATKSMYWPFSATFGTLGVIGRLGSDIASPIVMTAVTATPAASNGPATLTATYGLIANQGTGPIAFNSVLRKLPVKMRLYPYTSGGGVVFFIAT